MNIIRLIRFFVAQQLMNLKQHYVTFTEQQRPLQPHVVIHCLWLRLLSLTTAEQWILLKSPGFLKQKNCRCYKYTKLLRILHISKVSSLNIVDKRFNGFWVFLTAVQHLSWTCWTWFWQFKLWLSVSSTLLTVDRTHLSSYTEQEQTFRVRRRNTNGSMAPILSQWTFQLILKLLFKVEKVA